MTRGRGGRRALLPLFLVAAAGVALPVSAQDSPLRERTVYEDLQMFSQVLNQIRVNHPDTLDSHALFMAAIEGMVRAADPHSFVIPAARLAPEKEQELREGRLRPVPITFRFVGGAPVVVGTHPGSGTAFDIFPGDELVAIDGQPVTAATAQELELVLSGREGTEVALAFDRRRLDGSYGRIDRTVKREKPAVDAAVPAAIMLDSVVGYIRVTTFAAENVSQQLHRSLSELEDRGMEGLVLDLRDNGGGLLDEAAEVAGAFLPRNTVVYTSSGRKTAVVDTGRVSRGFWKSHREYPLVVLVNEGSASASELVAGALQDHDRALIVGRATFGKALLMQGFPLTDRSLMMLVVGQIHTPCGRSVQREYRPISTREYYRTAGEDRDRAGRPTCTTSNGRTVYGGGGIYPDHVLPVAPTPVWLSRLHEGNLILRWIPGLLQDGGAYHELEPLLQTRTLPRDHFDAFLAFAAKEGVDVPEDRDAYGLLHSTLMARIIDIRFGSAGLYRYLALHDPEVTAAAAQLPHAAALLRTQP